MPGGGRKRTRQGAQLAGALPGAANTLAAPQAGGGPQNSFADGQRQAMSSTTRENMTDVRFDSLPLSVETKQ